MVAGGAEGGLPLVALETRQPFHRNRSTGLVPQFHKDVSDPSFVLPQIDAKIDNGLENTPVGSLGIVFSEESDDEDFYLGSLDEDSFKEALEEFAKGDSKAFVITNTAKKYIQCGIDPKNLLSPESAKSRRFSLKNPSKCKETEQLDINTLRRFSLKSSKSAGSSPCRTAGSSPISERRFSLRAGSPKKSKASLKSSASGKSWHSSKSGQSAKSSSSQKVPRTHLVKRQVKTPDGKKKIEYSFGKNFRISNEDTSVNLT